MIRIHCIHCSLVHGLRPVTHLYGIQAQHMLSRSYQVAANLEPQIIPMMAN